MNISICITKVELLAVMAYHQELEKIYKMIAEGFGQKEPESESGGFKIPTLNKTSITKAFRAQASLGMDGVDIKLDVEPQFITELLELYVKIANKVAIPIAQFVMAMVMSGAEFERDAKALAKKWIKGEKEVTEN